MHQIIYILEFTLWVAMFSCRMPKYYDTIDYQTNRAHPWAHKYHCATVYRTIESTPLSANVTVPHAATQGIRFTVGCSVTPALIILELQASNRTTWVKELDHGLVGNPSFLVIPLVLRDIIA
jgi:hypothetical protein